MSLTKRVKRLFRFRIRSVLLTTILFGIAFAHFAETKRAYDRERQAIAKIPKLTISKPVSVPYHQQWIDKRKASWANFRLTEPATKSPWNNPAWTANIPVFL